MMIIFLYVLILLPFSLFFLLHRTNKHAHHFFSLDLVTTFHATNSIDNYKLHTDSSTITVHVLDSPPPPKQIGFVDDIVEGIEGLMMTRDKNFGFQTIDINDEIDDHDNDNDNDNNNNEDEDEDDCWKRTRVVEGRGNFPPPLSSLNEIGQPSFVLVPMRENGRLQLNKVRINRPKILYAMRQVGRLRLFLVPDQCVENNVEEEEEEQELVDDFDVEEEMEEEELIEESMEEEELIEESMKEEEEDDEVVEDTTSYENNKEIRIQEWKFPNERFRKCHQVVNHHHHVHDSHQHLCMYGVGIA